MFGLLFWLESQHEEQQLLDNIDNEHKEKLLIENEEYYQKMRSGKEKKDGVV